MDEPQFHVDYVGPFETHRVVVDGWQVPLLDATPLQGGRVLLSLDSRFGLELTLAEAERVVPFVAHAIAIASGFAGHPSGKLESRPLGLARPRRLLDLDQIE